jgi:transcriptional regulator with XRE-family HTH domain
MSKLDSSSNIYNEVKSAIKSLNLDQYQLAEKLGVTQAAISKALNGKSDRTFQRLLALLTNEHGMNFTTQQHVEMESLREELRDIKASLEELKDMISNLKSE